MVSDSMYYVQCVKSMIRIHQVKRWEEEQMMKGVTTGVITDDSGVNTDQQSKANPDNNTLHHSSNTVPTGCVAMGENKKSYTGIEWEYPHNASLR